MIKAYYKYIVENKSIIYIITPLALILRWGLFVSNAGIIRYNEGFLSEIITAFLGNEYISFLVSFLFTVAIAFYVNYINEKYNLIRVRTSLPYSMTMLLMCGSPSLVHISPAYFSILFLLVCIDLLFISYQDIFAGRKSYQIGFLLAIGSLFSPVTLIYLPLFWIGFSILRSMRFKVILASLLGLLTVYWLLACWLYYTGDISSLWMKFYEQRKVLGLISFVGMKIPDLVLLIISLFFMAYLFIYNYSYSFKDKIQVRFNISFVNLLILISVALYILFNFTLLLNLMVILSLGSLTIVHHFATIEKKQDIYLFVSFLLFYLIFYFYFLFI